MVNVTLRGVGDHVEINGCNAGPQRSTDLDYRFSAANASQEFLLVPRRGRGRQWLGQDDKFHLSWRSHARKNLNENEFFCIHWAGLWTFQKETGPQIMGWGQKFCVCFSPEKEQVEAGQIHRMRHGRTCCEYSLSRQLRWRVEMQCSSLSNRV